MSEKAGQNGCNVFPNTLLNNYSKFFTNTHK